jgi:hypothetical protein
MTLVVSLIFVIALAMSVGVIVLTMGHSMPRIKDVIEIKFASVIKTERRIIVGEIRGCAIISSGDIIAFPRKITDDIDYRIAA